jgi:exopolyphosphatase / guanosine-5'-triphosphate,3'-diphosphate pyrophosphatase
MAGTVAATPSFKQCGREKLPVTLPRAAVIDIGSNTTRLLVAEPDRLRPGGVVEVAAQRTFVRLTAAERAHGIPPDKAQALCEAVAEQALLARAHHVVALRVVATAALRQAPGRELLLTRLSEAAGTRVEIISGEEEARLAFKGATAPLADDAGVGRVVVADIGGGSTELACGAPGEAPSWWASLPVGSGVFTEDHFASDPPTADELARARADADAAIAAAGCPRADVAWAVGGSATSLCRLCGETLTADALDAALGRVTTAPARRAAIDLGLHVERVRLLPAGLLLLAAVARAASCPLHVGCGGLREGVILDLLARVG